MFDILVLIMKSPLLLFTGLALLAVNVILISLLLPYIKLRNVGKIVNSGLSAMKEAVDERKVLHQLNRYTSTIKIKMNPIEMLDFNFIEKSNIKHFPLLSFFNIYLLFGICLIIFVFVFQPIYRITYSPVSTFVISLIFAFIPFIVLELIKTYNVDIVRRELANLTSILSRWCSVKEDILYAFEKTVNSGLREPLKTYIRDLTIQVKKGVDMQEALILLSMKVDSPQFKDFVLNVGQNLRHGGNIIKLLKNLESEYFRMEKEYHKRKSSTFKYRLMIYVFMVFVLVIARYFLANNPSVMQFYLNTREGQMLLTVFSLMYFAAVMISLKISKFNY